MKHIPQEYLNQKVKLTKRDGYIIYGYITEINRTCICFETKSKVSLLGIRFIEDISLAKHIDISPSSPTEKKQSGASVVNLPQLDKGKSRKDASFSYSKWWRHEVIKE